MAYSISFKGRAAKQLAAVPKKDQRRIRTAVDALASKPRPTGCKKLSAAEGLWRIRVGDYRVVYSIADKQLVVLVVRIGHRRVVYR